MTPDITALIAWLREHGDIGGGRYLEAAAALERLDEELVAVREEFRKRGQVGADRDEADEAAETRAFVAEAALAAAAEGALATVRHVADKLRYDPEFETTVITLDKTARELRVALSESTTHANTSAPPRRGWVEAYTLVDDGLQIQGPDGKRVASFRPMSNANGMYSPNIESQRRGARLWYLRLNEAFMRGREAAP